MKFNPTRVNTYNKQQILNRLDNIDNDIDFSDVLPLLRKSVGKNDTETIKIIFNSPKFKDFLSYFDTHVKGKLQKDLLEATIGDDIIDYDLFNLISTIGGTSFDSIYSVIIPSLKYGKEIEKYLEHFQKNNYTLTDISICYFTHNNCYYDLKYLNYLSQWKNLMVILDDTDTIHVSKSDLLYRGILLKKIRISLRKAKIKNLLDNE